MTSIKEHLLKADPLTRNTALFLVGYSEEDDRVDYKETMDVTSEKSWLEITKDISSFANTYGGYLVFGVNDTKKTVVGLSRTIADTIKEVNNLHQKINRHLEPDLVGLRAKEFRIEGKIIVIVYIPQSVCITHMVSKDGNFKYPSGVEKTLLQKGTFYTRRSGGNHLGDSRDLNDVIERRIDQFREALMEKVARVVRSPANSEVLIVTEDKEANRFIITDSPDATPIKGRSFTVSPETTEDEIATWKVLSKGKAGQIPSPPVIWTWYAEREQLDIDEEHKTAIFQFSLWSQVPSFYWIKDIKSERIREILIESVRNRLENDGVNEMLVVASFLGKNFYKRILSMLGDYRERINPNMKHFPERNAKQQFLDLENRGKKQVPEMKTSVLAELNSIAEKVKEIGEIPALLKRLRAFKLDCFLYSRDDQYK